MAIRRTLIPLALLAGTVAAALSCKDPSPTGFSLQAARVVKTTGGTTSTGLVLCPQSYASASKVIGPKGDTIQVGNHILWVDSLVLTDTVTITAVAPADSVRWVRFQPEGLLFPPSAVDLSYGMNTGAILYTNYKGCLPSSSRDSVRIAQVSDSLSILGYLRTWSKVNRNTWSQGQQWVAGELPHFSNYAVAW